MTGSLVAVTGATGFLGFHLVPALERAGYTVRALRRPGLDFSDSDALRSACAGAFAVVHAAGLVSYDRAEQPRMHETHVALTSRLLEAARSAGVRRFVHVSSIVTLGHGPAPRDESAEYNAAGLRLAYWDTKTEAERIALGAGAPGFEVIAVNPGSLLGEGEKNGQLLPFVRQLAGSERPFLPDGGSDFVDAADVAGGTVLALQRGRSGQRYVLGSENLSYAQFHGRLRRCLGKPSRPRVVPRWVLSSVERVLAFVEMVTRLDPRFNAARLRRVNGVFMFHDLTKARTELGYRPAPIDRALRAMLEEKRE